MTEPQGKEPLDPDYATTSGFAVETVDASASGPSVVTVASGDVVDSAASVAFGDESAASVPAVPAIPASQDPDSPLYTPDFTDIMAPVKLPNRRPPLRYVVAGVVGAVLVVALVATLVVTRPFSSVAAADYSEASKSAAALQTEYESVSASVDDALGFLYSQDAAYDAAKSEVLKESAAKFGRSVDAFSSLKANRDKDVSGAYDTYTRQAKHFTDLADDLAGSAEALSAMVSACGNAPSGTMYDADFYEQYEAYVSSCRAAVEPLAQAPASVVEEFSGTLSSRLDQMADVVAQMRSVGSVSDFASSSDEALRLQDLSAQLVDLDASYGAINEFQDTLQQARANADPTSALTALADVLRQGYDAKSKQ